MTTRLSFKQSNVAFIALCTTTEQQDRGGHLRLQEHERPSARTSKIYRRSGHNTKQMTNLKY